MWSQQRKKVQDAPFYPQTCQKPSNLFSPCVCMCVDIQKIFRDEIAIESSWCP